ncbi:14653_t:CDS:2 [Funneliformis geosporum]|nr:14653_t:CDS:2 [Funneliformis geosporum]
MQSTVLSIHIRWQMKKLDTSQFAKQLAVSRLHRENSIHRDLHSGNILYSEYTEQWYISDFGFCGPADKPLGSIYGNLPYIAPEVIFGKGYTFASDIFSIGMLMWEISSGQPPFAGLEHNYDLVMKIMNGVRPKLVPGTPLEYANLIVQCWDADPLKRYDIDTLDDKIKEIRKSSYQNENESNLFTINFKKDIYQSLRKIETVTVSGKLNKLISDGTTLRLGISNGGWDAIFSESADFCAVQGNPCPAGPGTKLIRRLNLIYEITRHLDLLRFWFVLKSS